MPHPKLMPTTPIHSKRASKYSPVVQQIAQQVFGYDHLRPGQNEVLSVVLKEQDVLAVMPTGSGKSAIYQIAALRLPGVTLVISPLIALQQDQVDTINQQGAVKAAVLNSTLNQSAYERVFEQLENDELEFVFLAPEQFSNPKTLERLKAVQPSLFVVDEAHCVSEWGHDFRPDYLQLGAVIEALGHPVTLALTATASPLVRKEIIDRLGMNQPVEIVKGFDRPNIELTVYSFYSEKEKRTSLLNALDAAQTPAIVYTATRKAAERIAADLRERFKNACAYHAGMSASDRTQIQQQFMNDEIDIIVATSAFGMGIDKANVRGVYHYHIPGSIDAYYQEVGRAARDGNPAIAALFYQPDDMKLQRFFSGGAKVDEETLSELAELLLATTNPMPTEQLKQHFDLSQAKLSAALSALTATGVIEQKRNGDIVVTEDAEEADLSQTIDQAMTQQQRRKQFDQSRLQMVRGYAETETCRRSYLLSYFGEAVEKSCGRCDRCQATKTAATCPPDINYPQPFPLGSKIIHTNFGIGQVLRYDDEKVNILFETVGYKTFVTEIIENSVTCISS